MALTYSAWEVYVEESLVWVIGQGTRTGDPSLLPSSLREWVTKRVSDPWALSETGRHGDVARFAVEEVCGDEKTKFGLNTASPRNVIQLHKASKFPCQPKFGIGD